MKSNFYRTHYKLFFSFRFSTKRKILLMQTIQQPSQLVRSFFSPFLFPCFRFLISSLFFFSEPYLPKLWDLFSREIEGNQLPQYQLSKKNLGDQHNMLKFTNNFEKHQAPSPDTINETFDLNENEENESRTTTTGEEEEGEKEEEKEEEKKRKGRGVIKWNSARTFAFLCCLCLLVFLYFRYFFTSRDKIENKNKNNIEKQ